MAEPTRRTVILPALNEEGYIATMIDRTIETCETVSDPFEIIVVDNASTDTTAELVADIALRDPRVRLISHSENLRYAASCLTGTKVASGDHIFIIDSDGQHPPSDLWKFDAQLEAGCDLVFGRRDHRQQTLKRRALSRALLWLTRWYLGFKLHDVNCGIRGFNRRYAEALEIKHRVNLVNPELFTRARLGGFDMCEVPVIQEQRKAGVSSQDLRRMWRLYREVSGYLKALRRELRTGTGAGSRGPDLKSR